MLVVAPLAYPLLYCSLYMNETLTDVPVAAVDLSHSPESRELLRNMDDKTLETIASYPNLCRFIHLPVQSGSDNMLKTMNRKYTRAWYLDRIAAIRRIVPDASIGTDIFCGFSGETEEDHAPLQR